MELFAALPENFDAMSDEDLTAWVNDAKALAARIKERDPELVSGLTEPDLIDAMKAGVADILKVQDELKGRAAQHQLVDEELAAQLAQISDVDTSMSADDPGDEDDSDAGDGTDEAEASAELSADEPVVEEPVVEEAAMVASAPPLRRLPAQGRHAAIQASPANHGIALTASADLDGFKAGQELDSDSLARAVRSAARRKTAVPAGFRDHVVVASLDLTNNPAIPEYRKLHDNDETGNTRKIEALVAAAKNGIDPDADAFALTASGGICAPVAPYYELANVSTVLRSVRDALVGFIADRGGINFAPPPVISQITDAVGIITADQDAAGGSAGTKSCQTVICPDFEIVTVDSIYHCVIAGNLGARAFPEQIAQFNVLVLAQHARVAETNLLNAIKAGSTAVTANGQAVQGDGAIATLLNDILLAAAGMRSRNRMVPGVKLQAILPVWTADMLVSDLIASQFGRFEYNQAGVTALLGTYGINVAWTLDGPSDGTQVFGAQGASALVNYPTDIEWALFPAGSWLFVDSGVLELGIVRDSVLNATNSYQIFGESWENAAGVGVESLWVTSTVCPTGAVSALATPAGC